MILQSLDGVKRMEPSTGLWETLGEVTGVRVEISDSSEVLITWVLKVSAHGQLPETHGPRIKETRPNPQLNKPNQNFSTLVSMKTNATEFLQKKSPKMSNPQDPTNTWTSRTYQRFGTGETSTVPTGFPGPETSTFPNTAVAAGLTARQVPLLTESTLPETEHGRILLFRLKQLSTAEQVDHAMVVIQQVYTFGLSLMVCLKKLAKITRPRTLSISVVRTFRSVWTVLLHLETSLEETRVTAGPKRDTPYGRSRSMGWLKAPKEWKPRSTPVVPFPAVLTPPKSSKLTQAEFLSKSNSYPSQTTKFQS